MKKSGDEISDKEAEQRAAEAIRLKVLQNPNDAVQAL
jgi:hypothetical protein